MLTTAIAVAIMMEGVTGLADKAVTGVEGELNSCGKSGGGGGGDLF